MKIVDPVNHYKKCTGNFNLTLDLVIVVVVVEAPNNSKMYNFNC